MAAFQLRKAERVTAMRIREADIDDRKIAAVSRISADAHTLSVQLEQRKQQASGRGSVHMHNPSAGQTVYSPAALAAAGQQLPSVMGGMDAHHRSSSASIPPVIGMHAQHPAAGFHAPAHQQPPPQSAAHHQPRQAMYSYVWSGFFCLGLACFNTHVAGFSWIFFLSSVSFLMFMGGWGFWIDSPDAFKK